MKIFLFTGYFPCRRAEPFLITEFPFMQRAAAQIVIVPLFGKPGDFSVPLPGDASVRVKNPVFLSPTGKVTILAKGVFNFAPLGVHLRDLFRHVRSTRQFMHWVTSLLVTRAVLSHRGYREAVREARVSADAVLYFYWGDHAAWTLPYLRKRGIRTPAVVRMHGSDLYEHLKGGHHPLRRAILAAADWVAPVSEFGLRYLRDCYPAYREKFRLARLGVHEHGLNPDPGVGEVFTIVSVSNVVAVKRLDLLFAGLNASRLKIRWHHFGDGVLMNALRAKTAGARAGLEVTFHGHVPAKDLMRFYKETPVHLLVNTSASEGLPVSVMEAMSFGIPVLATDVGGTGELVNRETGVLVPSSVDAMGLARELDRLLTVDRAAYQSMRAGARLRYGSLVRAEKTFGEFYENLKKLVPGT